MQKNYWLLYVTTINIIVMRQLAGYQYLKKFSKKGVSLSYLIYHLINNINSI